MRVVSYNILGNCYIKPDWYPHVPKEHIEWGKRKERLVQQLLGFQADILCLQEVEGSVFNEFYDELKNEGYQGLYGRKGFGRLDGCATFFKEKLFQFQGGNSVFYNDHGKNGIATGHIALIMRLQRGEKIVGIVNTHVRWNQPEKPPQEHRGYRQVKKLVDQHLKDETVDEWIVCGDFNAEDTSPVIQLIYDAGFIDSYEEMKQPTMNKDGLVRIDYIFHSPGLQAKPEKIMDINETTFLPSIGHPSDHLAVLGDFGESLIQ